MFSCLTEHETMKTGKSVAIYHFSNNQVSESATTTRFALTTDGNGHQGEVTEFEYESQETLEYPASFVITQTCSFTKYSIFLYHQQASISRDHAACLMKTQYSVQTINNRSIIIYGISLAF